jgi:quercetin dioxygenase-like cupin family protein
LGVAVISFDHFRIACAAAADESAINLNVDQMNWVKMEPTLGDASPERAIVHEDPETHITQFLVKIPPNFHVPYHWHHANETHTVITGKLVVEENGQRTVLGPGGFNFTPAKMAHKTETLPTEGALLFVSVDGPYDQFLAPPPKKTNEDSTQPKLCRYNTDEF